MERMLKVLDMRLCRSARLLRCVMVATALVVMMFGLFPFSAQSSAFVQNVPPQPSIERIDERQKTDSERLTRTIDRLRDHEAIAGHPVMMERVDAMLEDIQEIKSLLGAIVQGAWVLGVSVFLLVLERAMALYQGRRRIP